MAFVKPASHFVDAFVAAGCQHANEGAAFAPLLVAVVVASSWSAPHVRANDLFVVEHVVDGNTERDSAKRTRVTPCCPGSSRIVRAV